MKENLMNSDHKATTHRVRAKWDDISWDTGKACFFCGGQGYVIRSGPYGEYNMKCPECSEK